MMKRLSIAVLVAATAAGSLAAVGEAGKAAAKASPGKLTICHKTGSDSNAFRRITVSNKAFSKTLRGHLGHTGDAVVVGTGPCPSSSLTPEPSSKPPAKIEICHKTGSEKNPYRRITVSSRAVTSPSSPSGATLRGHLRHEGDIIAPGATQCPSGSGSTSQSVKLTAELRSVSGASGSGSATVTIRVAKSELCFTLSVSGVQDVTAAHLHRVSTGAVAVPLTAPTGGSSTGCVTVEKALLREIVASPGSFYVNVHTQLFSSGQVRGDLTR